jgi:hypothetical protein
MGRGYQCVICLERICKQRLPQCNHALCLSCLESWVNRSLVHPNQSVFEFDGARLPDCPLCKIVIPLKYLEKQLLNGIQSTPQLAEYYSLVTRYEYTERMHDKLIVDVSTAIWIKENTRACPNCHLVIQRDGGCCIMTCARCKRVFNWYYMPLVDIKQMNEQAVQEQSIRFGEPKFVVAMSHGFLLASIFQLSMLMALFYIGIQHCPTTTLFFLLDCVLWMTNLAIIYFKFRNKQWSVNSRVQRPFGVGLMAFILYISLCCYVIYISTLYKLTWFDYSFVVTFILFVDTVEFFTRDV